MEIKEQIEKIVSELSKDPDLLETFKKDPAGAVKGLLKGDVPQEIVGQIVSAVKAKLSADKLSDMAGSLGKLFK